MHVTPNSIYLNRCSQNYTNHEAYPSYKNLKLAKPFENLIRILKFSQDINIKYSLLPYKKKTFWNDTIIMKNVDITIFLEFLLLFIRNGTTFNNNLVCSSMPCVWVWVFFFFILNLGYFIRMKKWSDMRRCKWSIKCNTPSGTGFYSLHFFFLFLDYTLQIRSTKFVRKEWEQVAAFWRFTQLMKVEEIM